MANRKQEILSIYKDLRRITDKTLPYATVAKVVAMLRRDDVAAHNGIRHAPLQDMRAVWVAAHETGLTDCSLPAFLLSRHVETGAVSLEEVESVLGRDAVNIIDGLNKVRHISRKSNTTASDNFRDLLLQFCQDMRVVLLIIAERVALMRWINTVEDIDIHETASEASYLYAPLAHKLGLYRLKSELEDLSLKYLQPDIYAHIKEKLNETKAAREQYINSFIKPIKEALTKAGLKYSVKGRTKSIHSIHKKMQKQQCEFEAIYDLFAIRIIIDSPKEREKADCWNVYSLVADMYQPNPRRLRDWLSIPKSNGYESLHTTVMGPGGRWVEVQIRSARMDDIAERGVAAHWRYKGQAASTMDTWLQQVREILENAASLRIEGAGGGALSMQSKMELYGDEVFVFTPKGDLFKLPKGSTVLDFAFHVHSRVGCACVGAKVNGRNVRISTKLNSGDQVEVTTSSTQTPKQDWLNIVATSKARNKIRQVLKEALAAQAVYAKEDLRRKFRNRHIDLDEAVLMRFIVKQGYKTATEFYQAIAEGKLEVGRVVDLYLETVQKEQKKEEFVPYRSAEQFEIPSSVAAGTEGDKRAVSDELIISDDLSNVKFSLARCCAPIYGDDVFGFVSSTGGIKIHRTDCPNAAEMHKRFAYRILPARWAAKGDKHYTATLYVVGIDDIGIVTNISSLINKEPDCALRSMRIDSTDGLFKGQLTISIGDTGKLSALIRKLSGVKGVKHVTRN